MKFSNRLMERLIEARRIVALTGAGVSAESGVPTFRGNDGIWSRFKPEELATVDAFMKNPQLVWEWYAHRKKIIASIQPNAGHVALARMEEMFEQFVLVTQNIDNLHRRAGSKTVLELHGNIERNYCMKCGSIFANDEVTIQAGAPRCEKKYEGLSCDGLVRPDVAWFGELIPEDQWKQSARAAESADVFLSIGTSGVVYPAASLPLIAKRSGAYLVEVNTERTALSDLADEFLEGASGVVLPALCDRLKGTIRSPGTIV
ncbi:MAG: NAD-dependent deacylase [Ignavibacteriae bacterium]|nr:NAD-dependent deacylase [Ignavibacteriota bacterium]